ncbi:MAG: hypothetical protein GY694_00190 [Gammaproteobacteria bacterium]|nr:hypothetical protein [Gammaproteobacteria bacterium]
MESLQAIVDDQITGITVSDLGRDDCLDLLTSEVISKRFQDFTFVYDYPASQASLARLNAKDSRIAGRFEFFYGDLELANGFSSGCLYE